MMQRQLARGFTLIEVLIAIVLVSVMALLAWRGLDGMAGAADQTAQHEQRLERLHIGLAQWSADLDALIDTGVVTALDFNGQRLRLTRLSANPSEGVIVVAWTIQNQQLQRWVSPAIQQRSQLQAAWLEAERWSRSPMPQDATHSVALTPVAAWQLFYFRGNAWSNPQSSAATEGLPDGVRLVLQLPSGGGFEGKLTHDWVQPSLGATK